MFFIAFVFSILCLVFLKTLVIDVQCLIALFFGFFWSEDEIFTIYTH